MEWLQEVRHLNPYDFLAWAVIITVVVIFWRWHLNPHNRFNLMDLFCDDGKVSSGKFMRTGSWVVMSYGFYVISNQSPDLLVAYSTLYGCLWVSARAVDIFQKNNPNSNPPEKKDQ